VSEHIRGSDRHSQMNDIPELARVADCGPVGLRRPATIPIPAQEVKLEKSNRGLRPK
jgi:hypothetical protein